MAVRTLTYRDLTAEQRTQGARKARERLLGFLDNPFMTADQREAVYAKIGALNLWEKLSLDDGYPPSTMSRAKALRAAPAQPVAALPPAPQHHEVGLSDTVPSTDDVS